jgi:hypothetical protein
MIGTASAASRLSCHELSDISAPERKTSQSAAARTAALGTIEYSNDHGICEHGRKEIAVCDGYIQWLNSPCNDALSP